MIVNHVTVFSVFIGESKVELCDPQREIRKLSMIRNKVVWDKHYYSNRFTVRNIVLLCYSRFRLICIFKIPLLALIILDGFYVNHFSFYIYFYGNGEGRKLTMVK